LRRLAATTAAAARRTGLDVDHRPYRPHLTIARARQPVDVGPLLDRLSDHRGPAWTAGSLHLVRSRLAAHADRGSVYETVASWPLGGG
ncbi:MAG: 2'-5' RNA ligase family protein, partial [Actinomycetes bacterium]